MRRIVLLLLKIIIQALSESLTALEQLSVLEGSSVQLTGISAMCCVGLRALAQVELILEDETVLIWLKCINNYTVHVCQHYHCYYS